MQELKTIRQAGEADAEAILGIYAPFCRETIVSFEVEPPSVAQMSQRLRDVGERFPWLVCELEGRCAGYAYAARHRERAGYAWSADVAIYVAEGYRRAGIGRALYTSLFAALRLQGFVNAFAGITLPNPASVALHEALGFERIATYRNVGFKLGAWHDVGWWQLSLAPLPQAPVLPVPAAQLIGTPAWCEALAAGLAKSVAL
jgi:phosphinothricin acetyltransferase